MTSQSSRSASLAQPWRSSSGALGKYAPASFLFARARAFYDHIAYVSLAQTDLLHWADLLDYFDDLLSEYVSAFPELKLQGSSKAGKDLPCTSGCLLRVLHVSRMILDNSGNKHLYASSEVRRTIVTLFIEVKCSMT